MLCFKAITGDAVKAPSVLRHKKLRVFCNESTAMELSEIHCLEKYSTAGIESGQAPLSGLWSENLRSG